MRLALPMVLGALAACTIADRHYHVPPDADADADSTATLTVSVSGEGTVASVPAGIDCGSDCTEDFEPSTNVDLTAVPASSSVFEDWSGACTGTSSSCNVVMDAAKMAGARFALHGAKRWSAHVSFLDDDYIEAVQIDGDGNVIVAGTVDEGGKNPDLYIVKYARVDGAIIWEQQIETPLVEIGVSMDIDSFGNVYVCSAVHGNGSTTIAGDLVSADVFGNVLAVRLAGSTGSPEWAKSWGGSSLDACGAIAVSGTDVFVGGTTSSNPATFGTHTIPGNVGNAFLVRAPLDSGIVAAAKHVPGSIDVYDAAVSGNGTIAIVGQISGSMTLDSCSLSLSGGASSPDGMLLEFDRATLACVRDIHFGSSANNAPAIVRAIAAYPTGGWVVAGGFLDFVNFGTPTYVGSNGSSDAFVARYTETGNYVWAYGYGGTGSDYATGVDVTPAGEVILGGHFSSTITFGVFDLVGSGDVFLTRMSTGPAPTHEWAVAIGGTAVDLASKVAVDSDGTVTMTAGFNGMTEVGGTSYTSMAYDAWVGSFVR